MQGMVKGPEQLVSTFVSCQPLARGNRHLTHNMFFHDAPGAAAAGAAPAAARTARASSYRLLHRASNPPAVLATGTIEDDFVWSEEGRRWQFLRRQFVMDPPAMAPEAQQRALQQQ